MRDVFYRNLVILLFAILLTSRVVHAQFFFNEQSLKFGRTIEWIDAYYVDTVEIDALVENAIREMLQKLDPHSAYISKEEAKSLNEPLQGNFEGVGVSFNILQDTIFIISTIPGGPAEKVGMKAGDRILLIEDENVAGKGIKNSQVFELLRGPKDTKVKVSVRRRGYQGLLDFVITRDKIPIYSVDAAYMIDDKTGYIKINRFSFTTMNEFNDALSKLRKRNAKDLVLDLTGNGGGYLDVAVSLADEFLEKERLIVYTEGKQSPTREYKATSRGQFEKGRLVVLIDEGSASASEIVAGAIQDWDRGVIIGRRSFGKGLVQRPLTFSDGSMIRLTIARYYTPSGRLIQKPYQNGSTAEYNKDLINRYNSGELTSEDSYVFPDSLRHFTLVNKRAVYSGGGIMPDFITPLDTSYYTSLYRLLLARGVLNRYVIRFVDEHRADLLKKYPDFNKFNKGFRFSDQMVEELRALAESEGIFWVEEEFMHSSGRVRQLGKAYIARDLWTTSEFYQVVNEEDPAYLKSLEVLANWETYQEKLLRK